MFERKKIILIILILAIVATWGWFFYQRFFAGKIGVGEKAKIKEIEYQHKDTTMGQVVEQDAALKVLEGYYSQNDVKRGDLVVIKLEGRNDFIRKIAAVPGDKIDFEEANLKINGKIVENSAGQPYLVADTKREQLKGKVPEDSYLVLSDETTPAAFDSREFGFVTKEQLKGKITP